MVDDYYAEHSKGDPTNPTTTPTTPTTTISTTPESVLHTLSTQGGSKIPQRRRDILQPPDITASAVLDYVEEGTNSLVNHFYGLQNDLAKNSDREVSGENFDQNSKISLGKYFYLRNPV